MTDPRPLTRDELAKFLPNSRAIRAFEKLFDLVPAEFEELLLLVEGSILSSQSLRSEVLQLKKELQDTQQQLALLSEPNLDPLIKRIEILEVLEG